MPQMILPMLPMGATEIGKRAEQREQTCGERQLSGKRRENVCGGGAACERESPSTKSTITSWPMRDKNSNGCQGKKSK